MTVGDRKKGFSIRIELGIKGIIGLGIVCFCIFLWMFLLGIWAGQTILQPFPQGSEAVMAKQDVQAIIPESLSSEQVPEVPPPLIDSSEPPPVQDVPPPKEPDFAEQVFFTLQVGAFREKAHAEKSVRSWREKGYDAFLLPPEEGNDSFTRVYIGKFAEVGDANAKAEELEKKQKVKALNALLPASKFSRQ